MDEWGIYLLLFVAGGLAGILNVIAGGGSFLILPLLIFLGLPASVANGTNRLAILLQNVGAVWGFHRYGVVDWRAVLWAGIPATIGSVFGTLAAIVISDEIFTQILAILMIAVTIWTLWNPQQTRLASDHLHVNQYMLGLGFFVVGLYGGFVQAGVGFLILAVTTMAGLDLVRGNAVKVLSVMIFSTVSLGLFAWHDKVDWPMGLALAVGNVLGGLWGVRLTVLKGHRWVKGVVTVAVLLMAVKLLVDP